MYLLCFMLQRFTRFASGFDGDMETDVRPCRGPVATVVPCRRQPWRVHARERRPAKIAECEIAFLQCPLVPLYQPAHDHLKASVLECLSMETVSPHVKFRLIVVSPIVVDCHPVGPVHRTVLGTGRRAHRAAVATRS